MCRAGRSITLTLLTERYGQMKQERPHDPASYNSSRAKPAYSAPAVLAPDGSWDFGPPTPEHCGRDAIASSVDAPWKLPLARAAGSHTQDEARHVDNEAHLLPFCSVHQYYGSGGSSGGSVPLISTMARSSVKVVSPYSRPRDGGVTDESGTGIPRRFSRGRCVEGAVPGGSVNEISRWHSSNSVSSSNLSSNDEPVSDRAKTSAVQLVVAPVLARMLGAHQDKQIQKAIAQLKLAFDNLDRQKPCLSRDLLTQMFDFVVRSQNPAVVSLMPRSVSFLGSTSALPSDAAQHSAGTHKAPPPGWPPHLPPTSSCLLRYGPHLDDKAAVPSE